MKFLNQFSLNMWLGRTVTAWSGCCPLPGTNSLRCPLRSLSKGTPTLSPGDSKKISCLEKRYFYRSLAGKTQPQRSAPSALFCTVACKIHLGTSVAPVCFLKERLPSAVTSWGNPSGVSGQNVLCYTLGYRMLISNKLELRNNEQQVYIPSK